MSELRSTVMRVVITPAQEVFNSTASSVLEKSTTSSSSSLLSQLLSHLSSHFSTVFTFSPHHYSPRHYFTLLSFFYFLHRFSRRYFSSRLPLTDRLFVITGGGGGGGGGTGIGREIALVLASKGARIALWDEDSEALNKVQEEILASFPRVICLPYLVDLSDRNSISTVARETMVKQGYVYGVINTAGMVNGKPFLEVEEAKIIKSVEVNVLSHVWTARAFLPHMIANKDKDEGGGHIVSVGSLAGLFGEPLLTDYCLSKFGCAGFIESLRLELEKLGHSSHIKTHFICPGHVRTELFRGYKPGWFQCSSNPKDVAQRVVEAIELGDEEVLVPRLAYLARLLKALLPLRVQDEFKRKSGANDSMDEWTGRNRR